jgi:Tfp pilus assembly protein PilF
MSSRDDKAKELPPSKAQSFAPKDRIAIKPVQNGDAQTASKGRFLARNTVADRKRGGNESLETAPAPEPPPTSASPFVEKPAIAGDEETWGHDEEAPAKNEDSPEKKGSKKVKKKGESVWRTVTGFRLPILPALAGVLAVAAIAATISYRQGIATGQKEAEQKIATAGLDIPPEVTAEVDAALMELRNGDPAKALATLKGIHEKQPRYPMVSYLVAQAATQVGDVALAEKCIAETLAKRERVSDALALQAVIESMRPRDPNTTMSDPKVRDENYLRQAILADPANAAPRFELATLLRYSNRRDEARKEIHAAQARLNPVDAHTVMEVTLALMDLEDKSDSDLPPTPSSARNLSEAFGGALTAMRKGEYSQAAALLESAKAMSSFDVFSYLVNDPLLRRYRDQPELAKFWQ